MQHAEVDSTNVAKGFPPPAPAKGGTRAGANAGPLDQDRGLADWVAAVNQANMQVKKWIRQVLIDAVAGGEVPSEDKNLCGDFDAREFLEAAAQGLS